MTLAHHCADSGLVAALELLAPQLEAAGIAPGALVDGLGRSVLDVGLASKAKPAIDWAAGYGAYAGQYRLEPGQPDYNSETSALHIGQEVGGSKRHVAVKVMRRRADWEQELEARFERARLWSRLRRNRA